MRRFVNPRSNNAIATRSSGLPGTGATTPAWAHLAFAFTVAGVVQLFQDGVATGTPGQYTSFPYTVFAAGTGALLGASSIGGQSAWSVRPPSRARAAC